MHMGIEDIAAATGARVLAAGTGEVTAEAVVDSRKAGKGSLFVAFAGEHSDGNDYLCAAARQGAAAVVATRVVRAEELAELSELGCAVLHAQDDAGVEFLLRLARAWRELHEDWLVVGVTGSVGKTTTKEMLAAAFGSQRRCYATHGNLNSLIGLPITVLSAPEQSEVVVLELGMNHAGEIARLSRACQPALACITNIGTSHIGLLGSREAIARTKAEIVEGMRAGAGEVPVLALNSAGDFTPLIEREYAHPAGVEVLRVGTDAEDAVRLVSLELDEQGCATAQISCSDGWTGSVHLPVPGRAAVDDALLALALVWRAGLDRDRALAAIERMPQTSMRLDVQTAPGGARIIDDSYNAAPASMASSLDVLSEMGCPGRRIAVLGEMGELGEEAERLHGYVGAYAAARGLDLLLCVGDDLAAQMAEAARTMGMPAGSVVQVPTAEKALDELVSVLGPDDLVLVKASRAAGLDRIVRGVLQR